LELEKVDETIDSNKHNIVMILIIAGLVKDGEAIYV
jgi:hypothetical protein